MIASREEIAKAEVEAWNKTHYRLDWLLYRTLGYAILSSTLAIYIFWAEAGHGDHPFELLVSLSLTWILLLGMALLWYDFHTRVSYEHWPEVRKRLSRHIVVSLVSFVAALIVANAIHGVSTLIDNAITAPSAMAKDVGAKASVVNNSIIHWNNRVAKNRADRKTGASKVASKTAAAVKPITKGATPPAKHVELYVPPKTNNGKAATPAKKPAPQPAKKAAPKPVVKKAQGLPRHPAYGTRTVYQGRKYHFYGGRWHLLRRQR